MNKRQVIILWAIAILLAVAVTAVKLGRVKETKSVTARTAGQTLLESFPAGDVATIEIKGANTTTHLAKKDGKWVVTDRDDFPANPIAVNGLLRTIGELKITQGMQAGPSLAPRFGMDETAKTGRDRGITTLFKDASGKEIATITIGKVISSASAPASPMEPQSSGSGHFVRNHADESGFYAVSEMFSELSDWPQRWLADDFIATDKIQSISVTEPGKSDLAWKVVRDSESAEFALEGQAAGEAIDPAISTSLKTIFGFTRYEDIVPGSEVEKRAANEQKQIATIVTFDGLTYKITIVPTKPGSTPHLKDPENPDQSTEDPYLVNYEISGEISKERKKPADEKPEDAKAADAAFTEASKATETKIAKEKAASKYTFQVGKAGVETLMKSRADLMKKPEPANPGAGPQHPTFRIPPGGMSATSPPIEAVMPTAPPQEEPKGE